MLTTSGPRGVHRVHEQGKEEQGEEGLGRERCQSQQRERSGGRHLQD